MKIAIIGAGPAGLIAIKFCIREGHECQAFEQTEFVGGTWNYTDEVGVDKNGIPVHTSMYKNLRTNLPKEVMMFENFSFRNDLKESYITQSEVLNYLNDYASKQDLRKHIKFLTQVTFVEPIANNEWNIETKDLITRQLQRRVFDAVIVCHGKYEVPCMPQMLGLESFKGRWIHSHDYRDAEHYRNKVVLVIGGGPSGLDIAKQLHQVAEKVFFSFKTSPFAIHFPDGPTHKPLVQRLEKNSVYFEDGTRKEVEEIIFCTGYHYNFPFLSEKCSITVDENYVKGFYKECICIEYPTMVYLGVPGSICPVPTFELQMRFFLAILSGHFQLPSKKEMSEDAEARRKAKDCLNRHYHKKGIKGEREYWNDLADTAKLKGVPNVFTKLHEYVVTHKRSDSHCFRILNDEEFEMR